MLIELRETAQFSSWLNGLRDPGARDRVKVRLTRLALGLAGDIRSVGEGVSELRLDYGPGYRVYFIRRGPRLTVLLAGGNKGTQRRDITLALRLARNL
jgi:putative addiction module killer protein